MVTEKQLRKAAREFNEVMDGLNPLIDTTLPEEELMGVLKEAITFIDPTTDHFSNETQLIIDELSPIEDLVKEKKPATKQEVAEKIHKQNVADKPVKTAPEVEQEEEEEEEEPVTPSGRKQVPIPVKKEKKELFSKKSSTTADRVAFIAPFIEKGKFTKAQLVEKLTGKFPDLAISSLQTMLTDAKNPKYNKFQKLVIQDDKGILSFKED